MAQSSGLDIFLTKIVLTYTLTYEIIRNNQGKVYMLNDWQIILLDNGIWLLPVLCVVSLAVFPWKHWNALLDSMEVKDA